MAQKRGKAHVLPCHRFVLISFTSNWTGLYIYIYMQIYIYIQWFIISPWWNRCTEYTGMFWAPSRLDHILPVDSHQGIPSWDNASGVYPFTNYSPLATSWNTDIYQGICFCLVIMNLYSMFLNVSGSSLFRHPWPMTIPGMFELSISIRPKS